MNRIILIGNGFDLAHGLKTSYKDFIDWFWETEATKIKNSNGERFEDDFIFVKKIVPWRCLQGNNTDYQDLLWNLKNSYMSMTYNNTFLKSITQKMNLQNWVDIEEEYYEELKNCINELNKIDKLNHDFEQIKKELKNYLGQVNDELKNYKIDFPITRIMAEMYANSEQINSLLFLNFNYTATHKFYTGEYNRDKYYSMNPNHVEKIKRESIQIHGNLKEANNPIVFGYGDEIGKEYSEIENLNDNRFLENVKTIKYLETDNYKKLLSFIDSEEYEIFIMGHSCGISDRTLLNTLFEHNNCVSIKVFYHKKKDGTDNFSDVIRNISRNFTNKAVMRRKVIDKMNSELLT